MIIDTREAAKAKARRVQNGYSAFAESTEMIRLLKRELRKQHIDVHVDETNIGSWFIPGKH